jgi:Ca2+-binding RTX toxin-like protein
MVRLRLIATLLAPVALLACPSAEAKVTARVVGQILTVQGGKRADRVKVVCGADANVKVNGRDPGTGPVLCSQVVEVDAVMRAGDDRVDFSGVSDAFGQRDLPGFGQGTGAAALLGPGNDTYIGSPTAFNLAFAGPGNDRMIGGALRDQLGGGPGNDTLRGLGANDLLLGGPGKDRVFGGPGDDLISGNAGDDAMFGGAGADLIGGGGGDDRLSGGPGPDRLFGGPGRDILLGGPGDDLLVGGPGRDLLRGGPGHNTLVQGSPKAK